MYQHLFSTLINVKSIKLKNKRKFSNLTSLDKHNYAQYYQLNSKCYGKNIQPSPEFLTWFIGFTEGDGSFFKAARGDLYFVITQDSRDKQVLEYIQKELKIGKVIKQGNTTSRFIIQDKLGLYLIALIFNGNIRSPGKLTSFNEWLKFLNEKEEWLIINHFMETYLKNSKLEAIKALVKLNEKQKYLILNHLFEERGGLSGNLIKNNGENIKYYKLLFGVDNKKELSDIISVDNNEVEHTNNKYKIFLVISSLVVLVVVTSWVIASGLPQIIS